jgi:hypothetical protein
MINKILDRLNERVVFGAVLFTILIGNPMRVIVGEATKAYAAPAPQVEQQIPANYKSICRTTGDYCEVPTKAQLIAQEQEEFVQKLCSKEYEEVRARIVYKALTSDVETPEEVKNYQAAVVILQVCPRNNVSY